jgi:predicted nucleotidyltransferase
MDKNAAIRLSQTYVEKVKRHDIEVLGAWLFGSYAKGNANEDSDIDLALMLPDHQLSFDTDVRLMLLRSGEETLIETHTYSKDDFAANTPIVFQIKKYGVPLEE